MSEILEGKILSQNIAERLKQKITTFATTPKLVIVQVGNNEESNTYVKHKKIYGEKIGVIVEYKKYEETIDHQTIIDDIEKCNKDNSVHGIIIQLPIPRHFQSTKIIDTIDSRKDVDGLTSVSFKHLFDNNEGYMPATTKAIFTLLDSKNIELKGKKVVIVGQSTLVGRPTALAMLNRNGTVTVCHTETKNLDKETKQADILIVATGSPHLITEKHVSSDQIIIDIGITVLPHQDPTNGLKKVVGDVDFQNVKDKVKAITPVPGGVGPLTIACLFENLIQAYESVS